MHFIRDLRAKSADLLFKLNEHAFNILNIKSLFLNGNFSVLRAYFRQTVLLLADVFPCADMRRRREKIAFFRCMLLLKNTLFKNKNLASFLIKADCEKFCNFDHANAFSVRANFLLNTTPWHNFILICDLSPYIYPAFF